MDIQIFVGVDCDEQQLTLGLIGSQGILRSLSRTTSPLPDHLGTFGQRLNGMIRGLRGETNLRMKNFRGIGIGVPGRYVSDVRNELPRQLKPLLDFRVQVEDREALAVKGSAWLKDVADMLDPRIDREQWDLSVVYGAAKLAIDRRGTSEAVVEP